MLFRVPATGQKVVSSTRYDLRLTSLKALMRKLNKNQNECKWFAL